MIDFVPRNIAVFRWLYLGDLLCAVPALRSLRHRFPEASITLIGMPWAEAFVERTPYIDRLLPYGHRAGAPDVGDDLTRIARYLSLVRRAGFDLAIQMHGSGSLSNTAVKSLNARYTIGYGPCGADSLDCVLPWSDSDHEIDRWLRVVGMLGGDTSDRSLEFSLTPADDTAAVHLLNSLPPADGPVIGLHPGAKLAARRWPAGRFAALGDALARRCDARIVITGSGGERDLAREVCEQMTAPALNLAGQTDLGSFGGVIRRLDLLVTNDTGASHLAAALRTPSVVLFGPTRPQQWAPLDRSRHSIIDAAELAGPGVDPADALARLAVEPVGEACIAALARPRTSPELQLEVVP